MLHFQPPTAEIGTNFVPGLWLTPEVYNAALARPELFLPSYYNALREPQHDTHSNVTLVVWIGTHNERVCFDARAVAPISEAIPFTEGVHGDSYIVDHKYIYVHKDCELQRLLHHIDKMVTSRAHGTSDIYEDLPTIAAFTKLATYFKPSPSFQMVIDDVRRTTGQD